MRDKRNVFLLIVVIFWGFGCTNNDPSPFSPYFQESFPDLDLGTISGLETPYENIFGNPSGGRTDGTPPTLSEISTKLADIFPDAVVLAAELETERGLSVWDIKLKMPGGGILRIDFVQDLGEILKMEGKTGPFTYDVNPGGDFISLSDAFTAAKSSQDGDIVKWKLSLEEENKWEYEVHINNEAGRFEIEVNAFTGELLSTKIKEENDDREDNEDEDKTDSISQELENYVHNLLAGDIVHSEVEDSDWKIYVKTSEGAVVQFRITDTPYTIVKIEGEHGPFTYDIDPGENRITFASAKEIALGNTSGEIEEWQLGSSGDSWIYEFEISNADGTSEIKIDALTGDIL